MRFVVLDYTFPRNTMCFLISMTDDKAGEDMAGASATYKWWRSSYHSLITLTTLSPSLFTQQLHIGTGSELASGGGAQERDCWHATTMGTWVQQGDKDKCCLHSREGRSSCCCRGDMHHA